MTQTSTINALPYPEDTDAPDGPLQIQALVNRLDSRLLPRFANASSRDGSISSPANGMLVWLDTPGCFSERSGNVWVNRYVTGTPIPWTGLTNYAANTAFPGDPLNGDVALSVAISAPGVVWMRGTMYAGNGMAGLTNAAFVPAGFRPSSPRIVWGNITNDADNSSLDPRRVRFDLFPSGALQIKRAINGEEGKYINFDGTLYSL